MNDVSLRHHTYSKNRPQYAALENFLKNPGFYTPNKCPYTNYNNQMNGQSYYIPPEWGNIAPIHIEDMERGALVRPPLDELFYLLEDCRRAGLTLHFAERQYFHVPPEDVDRAEASVHMRSFAEHLNANMEEDQEDEDLNKHDIPAHITPPHYAKTGTPEIKYRYPANVPGDELARAEYYDHSCIELDFDIYQAEQERVLDKPQYAAFVQGAAGLLCRTLDFSGTGAIDEPARTTTFWVAVLRKPKVANCSHPIYGECFKDSIHMRFFVRVSKEYKRYFVKRLNDEGKVHQMLGTHKVLCPVDKILDVGSVANPAMVLGSMKRSGSVAHEFYCLYAITVDAYGYCTVAESNEFNTVRTPIPLKPGQHASSQKYNTVHPRWNLCYETSMLYEARTGLIKKMILHPKAEIATEIVTTVERLGNSEIETYELDENTRCVCDLSIRNYEAASLRDILDILSIRRVQDYNEWFKVISILARANPEYKSLAIYFSMRSPAQWSSGGRAKLEQIWNQAQESSYDTRSTPLTTNSLYAWAMIDDPVRYTAVQNTNAYIVAREMVMTNTGRLNHNQLAHILKLMFGKKFVCAIDPTEGRSGSRVWYEFVFRGDQTNGINDGSLFKWRIEYNNPDTLDLYICDKLPAFIGKLITWVEEKRTSMADENASEAQQKYHDRTKKNLEKLAQELGNTTLINNIIKRAAVVFRVRGFVESLDKHTESIGVGNGVLLLHPRTELLECYHEYRISRTTCVNYRPYDPKRPTPKQKELLTAYQQCVIKPDGTFDEESFIFIMCYLSTSLDGRKKLPLLFILLGQGAQGKSAILEQHIHTLRYVTQGGYGAALDVDFFTKENGARGGPDSELMLLQHARFAVTSESEPGTKLKMALIKRITSDVIGASEKHKRQEMFHANCNFIFCSNNDPDITGRDYGTWRRIKVYNFKKTFYPRGSKEYQASNPCHGIANPKFQAECPKDPEYQEAYLGILVYYYGIYRDVYGCDLNSIPHTRIKAETRAYQDAQDLYSKFLSLYMVQSKIPQTEEEKKTMPPFQTLDEVVQLYQKWYVHEKNTLKPIKTEVIKEFKKTELNKYMKDIGHERYEVRGRRVLAMDEARPEEVEAEAEAIEPDAAEALSALNDALVADADVEDDFKMVPRDDEPDDEPDDAGDNIYDDSDDEPDEVVTKRASAMARKDNIKN
jgi:phage/plasmid-associated DNA primase